MTKRLVLVFLALFAATALFAGDTETPKGKLKPVAAKFVCMVNEHAMGKDQIPVEVAGKTYYGCCDMCKKALADDATKRVAIDPVSGKKVDKATAVIGAQEDGRVFYFENAKNLETWNAKAEISVTK